MTDDCKHTDQMTYRAATGRIVGIRCLKCKKVKYRDSKVWEEV